MEVEGGRSGWGRERGRRIRGRIDGGMGRKRLGKKGKEESEKELREKRERRKEVGGKRGKV